MPNAGQTAQKSATPAGDPAFSPTALGGTAGRTRGRPAWHGDVALIRPAGTRYEAVHSGGAAAPRHAAHKKGSRMATVQELIDDARAKLVANAKLAAEIGAVYKFVLTGEGGGTYLFRLEATPSVTAGDGAAACTIVMSAEDYVAMRERRVTAQELFFSERLKVEGDLGLAMKLQALNDLVG